MAAEEAITMFLLSICVGLFLLSFIERFHKYDIINLIIKRGFVVAGIFMFMFTATCMATLSDHATLGLNSEMLFLMQWIGWAGYVAAVFLVIMTLFDILQLKKQGRAKKDMEVQE